MKVRSYENYDRQRFVSYLEGPGVPRDEVALDDDTSDMAVRFSKRFLEVLDGHAPVKSVKSSTATADIYQRRNQRVEAR